MATSRPNLILIDDAVLLELSIELGWNTNRMDILLNDAAESFFWVCDEYEPDGDQWIQFRGLWGIICIRPKGKKFTVFLNANSPVFELVNNNFCSWDNVLWVASNHKITQRSWRML